MARVVHVLDDSTHQPGSKTRVEWFTLLCNNVRSDTVTRTISQGRYGCDNSIGRLFPLPMVKTWVHGAP